MDRKILAIELRELLPNGWYVRDDGRDLIVHFSSGYVRGHDLNDPYFYRVMQGGDEKTPILAAALFHRLGDDYMGRHWVKEGGTARWFVYEVLGIDPEGHESVMWMPEEEA